MKTKITLAGLFIITTSIVKSQSIDFTNCPTCSSENIALFTEITTKYVGVKGSNPSRSSTYNLVGDNKSAGLSIWDDGILETSFNLISPLWGKNWYPLRTPKQILVGRLASFGVHKAGDENDWNINISPNIGFESFISEALEFKMNNWYTLLPPFSDQDNWGTTPDGRFTIEAEITPRAAEFNNRWFNNIDGKTNLKDKTIGVYGPFVSEEAHGRRPEIHPTEQIWWKEDDDRTMILLVCDASNRFDEDSDYDASYAESIWKPWTQDKGQEAELLIPFELKIGKGTVHYSIQAVDTPNFYEGANYVDATEGVKHTMTYNNLPVLTVEESVSFDKYIGINFRDVCRTDDMLRGLIVINTAIGNGGGGREGFAALQIDKRKLGFNDKPVLVTGDIIRNANNWTTYNNSYDTDIQFGSTIISSDRHGEGIVDGMIDFDGNGITDLFTSTNGKWLVMYDAKGPWVEINRASENINDLRFGDVDGDNRTDVMYVNSRQRLLVSFGGTGRWKDFSNVEGLNSTNARVGDFNGDGKTDIIKRVDRYEASMSYAQIDIQIKYGCKDEWKTLQADFHMYDRDWEDRVRYGDFNGDGITDIFRQYDNKFQVYWSGRGFIKELCTPLITDINVKNNLLFVNSLSKKGFTDIIYVRPSDKVWKIYYDGKTTESGKALKYNDVSKICFGNFTSDDLWEPITMDYINQIMNPEQVPMSVAAKVKKEPFVLYKYRQGSIRSKLIDNKPTLFMDMDAVYYNGNSIATKTKNNFRTVSSVKMESGLGNPAFKKVGRSNDNLIGSIQNVPFSGSRENEIEIKFAAEARANKIEIPRYGIGVLKSKVDETVNGVGNLEKWEPFIRDATMLDTLAILANTPNKTELIKAITWELFPYYSGIENDKISIMEMPDAMKDLNAIIYGNDTAKTIEIFGSTTIFDIEWGFLLTDLTTGKVIPVLNPLSFISAGKWANNKISYSFPETNNLLELKVTATVKDKLGNKSLDKEIFTFYNQRISLADTEIESWADSTFPDYNIVGERLKKSMKFNRDYFKISPLELKQLLRK